MSEEDNTIASPASADEVSPSTAAPPVDAKKEDPKTDDADRALVKWWLARVKDSKAFAKKPFKKMDANEYLAAHGAEADWIASNNYVVAIVSRHINQAVAALYARDPVAQAKPRDKMRYKVWDGRQDTLQAALQLLPTGDPQAQAVVQDVLQARQQEELVKKTGRTLEILWKYFTAQQANGFKQQAKALVRRTKVDSVGYVKLAFQRVLEPRPEVAAQLEDATSEIARTEALIEEKKDKNGDWDADSAKAAELRSLIKQLQDREYMVVREGPVFDFPHAQEVIIDKKCKHLKTFAGARWIAQEFEFDDDEIKEIYGVDIKNLGTKVDSGDPVDLADADTGGYDASGKLTDDDKIPSRLVWEIQDKKNSQFLTVCDGYDGFLSPPGEPDVQLSRFFTIFPLVFNEIESRKELYPPSDVELLRDTQMEYNRSRQGLREHRQANRPKYAVSMGALDPEDLARLASHPANAVLELKALQPGKKIEDLVQRIPMVAIDPMQYNTQDFFSDIERQVGTQQATLGTGSNTTATETSIVEQGRQAGIGDNLDDLDQLISDLALGFGELCLKEMSVDIVQKIVGAGAVWPDAPPSRQDLSENIYLDIKGGSTGRPNRAVDLANLERAIPLFLQVPGINMSTIRDKVAILLDLDPEELVADGAPSITAINAMMVKAQATPPGAPPGGPGVPPNGAPPGGPGAGGAAMQGHAGGQNTPIVQGQPGPQPGMGQHVPA